MSEITPRGYQKERNKPLEKIGLKSLTYSRVWMYGTTLHQVKYFSRKHRKYTRWDMKPKMSKHINQWPHRFWRNRRHTSLTICLQRWTRPGSIGKIWIILSGLSFGNIEVMILIGFFWFFLHLLQGNEQNLTLRILRNLMHIWFRAVWKVQCKL